MLIPAPTVLALLAQTAAQQPPPQPTLATYLFPLTCFVVLFYFAIFRPQQRRAKEQATLLSALRSGDEVVTSGGLHGIVSNARDAGSKTLLVKFAENVKIEVDKASIVSVTKPGGNATSLEKASPAVKTV